ncbi:alpha/beta hydrolase [Acidiferrimicrobium sp. IK]|uniref:alpha/beta fold hydrolase n=1 Tax=Acidiferrimicrobium sp. IK TaxID=2871700 RepID=UPI0021CB7F25|nr:alpha/beta hydrolase [Acidiferrimicrobium sp. IK]MCU4184892.1 alpha/beta hydrolase [Acidiferrimicrobium sp. IK]
MPDLVAYDEFAYFRDNATEAGLAWDGPPVVERVAVEVAPGRSLSALKWGDGEPELVLLHGGAQNAHTWDTVALALRQPLLAVDLPGHGHSDGPGARPEGALAVEGNASDVAAVIRRLAPRARAVVGMSLGGLTTIALAAAHPDLVRAMVLVDITPGVNREKAAAISAFVQGPESFDSFDELLARTVEFNPTRTVSSLRRGILHNAQQQPDGTWVWRYRRFASPLGATAAPADYGRLWEQVGQLDVPVLLVRGMRPQSVVDDDDEAELLRRARHASVVRVEEAGHSVQGDAPVALAKILSGFPPHAAG